MRKPGPLSKGTTSMAVNDQDQEKARQIFEKGYEQQVKGNLDDAISLYKQSLGP